MKPWEKPEFEEVSVSAECTAYAGSRGRSLAMRTSCIVVLCASLSLIPVSAVLAGTPQDVSFAESVYSSGLGQITSLAWATDGSNTLFVAQKTGVLRVILNGTVQGANVLSLPVFTNSECGLIGVAVAPDYATTKQIYVFATVSSTVQRIYRYTIGTDGSGNLVGSGQTQIGPDLPTLGRMHDAGAIEIGPDNNIYFGVGNLGDYYNPGIAPVVGVDGTATEFTSLASKVGRMTRSGAAVSSNPWYNAGDGITAKDYIWAKGFRNPFGLRFHPVTGALWMTAVGDYWEQIFLVTAGSTQGYPTENNTSTTNGKLIPKFAYQTNVSTFGGCITRGIFYTGATFPSQYYRNFFFVDYNSGKVMRCVMDGSGNNISNVSVFVSGNSSLTDISQGPDGSLYYASLGGAVWRLRYAPQVAQNIILSTSTLSVNEGSSSTFTAKLATAPFANVTVSVTRSSGDTDVTASPGSLTFTAATWNTPQTVTVSAAHDADATNDSATITCSSPGLTSQNVTVTVVDDDTVNGAPSVSFTNPVNGAVVSATNAEWYGSVSDPQGVATVTKVEFYVDGVLKYTDLNSGASAAWHPHYGGAHLGWDTTTLADGLHTLKMTAFDSTGLSGSSQITVTVGNATGGYYYVQEWGSNGFVVMEAENYSSKLDQGGKTWSVTTAYPGYSGSFALQATPDTGVNNNTGYTTTSPRLNYSVWFTKTGIHHVWIRGLGPSGLGGDDSCHVGLDGVAVSSSDRIGDPYVPWFKTWTWSRDTMDGVSATINVSTPGWHTLNVWMREDGFIIDKILLTTNSAYVPSGNGPAYQQSSASDGLVSMEVESSRLSKGGKDWYNTNTIPGYTGAYALRAMPDTGVNNNTGYTTASPRIDFDVNFVKTGIHHVWIRGVGVSGLGDDDSCHVGLNGAALSSSDRISTFFTTWTWSRDTMDGVSATINVSTPGYHTINVWMREDGFVIDKIVLTTNASYVPSGTGPAESPR